MKTKLVLFLISIIVINSITAQIPYQVLIKKIKPSIVGIEAHDDTTIVLPNGKESKFTQYGSGVIVMTDSSHTYAITNEHVIAIKDSVDKTIRYADNIIISVNRTNGNAYPCQGIIYKVREDLDLVALQIRVPRNIANDLDIIGIPKSFWEIESNLTEGDIVAYSGFPLGLGRGRINSPLTRTGIISQLVTNSSSFLIDAFVQPGYSGSPVFLIKHDSNTLPTQWSWKLVGICQAYPYDSSPIFKEVKGNEIPDMYIEENPGFAIVIGISVLEELLK